MGNFYDLLLVRKKEVREPFVHLMILKCHQFKIISMPKQHILGDGTLWTPLKYNLHPKMNVSCVPLIDFYRLNLWLALWSISSVISTPAEPLVFFPVSNTAFLKKNRYSDCWGMGYICSALVNSVCFSQ